MCPPPGGTSTRPHPLALSVFTPVVCRKCSPCQGGTLGVHRGDAPHIPERVLPAPVLGSPEKIPEWIVTM